MSSEITFRMRGSELRPGGDLAVGAVDLAVKRNLSSAETAATCDAQGTVAPLSAHSAPQ